MFKTILSLAVITLVSQAAGISRKTELAQAKSGASILSSLIAKAQAVHTAKAALPKEITKAQAQKILKRADQDGSGEVTKAELKGVCWAYRLSDA